MIPLIRGDRCATRSADLCTSPVWPGGRSRTKGGAREPEERAKRAPRSRTKGGAVTDVYAGEPHRFALTESLDALRRIVDYTIVHTLRDDGPKRTRNRSHINETPARPHPPAGNGKPASGRVAVPGRPPTQPGPGQRDSDGPVDGETGVAVVPTQSTTGPPTEAEPPKYPARPDPSDAAAEVWALVERAQAGDAAAFGLIYDRYVDTVFRFVYFRVGNRQLAEDLTSDTFLRALKRI